MANGWLNRMIREAVRDQKRPFRANCAECGTVLYSVNECGSVKQSTGGLFGWDTIGENLCFGCWDKKPKTGLSEDSQLVRLRERILSLATPNPLGSEMSKVKTIPPPPPPPSVPVLQTTDEDDLSPIGGISLEELLGGGEDKVRLFHMGEED